MNKIILTILLIVCYQIITIGKQESYCQTTVKEIPDTISVEEQNRVIGEALILGTFYRDSYFNQKEINELLQETVLRMDTMLIRKDMLIDDLAFELAKKPRIILEHDWITTGVISGLAVAVVILIFSWVGSP